MDIINVNDVCLTLGKTEILKHINVSFEEGKIHGLIGRNGSGKTITPLRYLPDGWRLEYSSVGSSAPR